MPSPNIKDISQEKLLTVKLVVPSQISLGEFSPLKSLILPVFTQVPGKILFAFSYLLLQYRFNWKTLPKKDETLPAWSHKYGKQTILTPHPKINDEKWTTIIR
jgi:hypothetical protein